MKKFVALIAILLLLVVMTFCTIGIVSAAPVDKCAPDQCLTAISCGEFRIQTMEQALFSSLYSIDSGCFRINQETYCGAGLPITDTGPYRINVLNTYVDVMIRSPLLTGSSFAFSGRTKWLPLII